MTHMRWRDRMIMKIIGTRIVVNLLSRPIVLKIMMWEAQVLVSVVSLLRKRREASD